MQSARESLDDDLGLQVALGVFAIVAIFLAIILDISYIARTGFVLTGILALVAPILGKH